MKGRFWDSEKTFDSKIASNVPTSESTIIDC